MNLTKDENTLVRTCKEQGIECEQVNKKTGHWQIRGQLLVNYYPSSKNKTAYIAGTTEGVKGVEPKRAVRMSLRAPTEVGKKAKRKGSYKKDRQNLIDRGVCKCHWCGTGIDASTATMEHIIPLSRGGLDHDNNRTLACADCNSRRGSDMPELN